MKKKRLEETRGEESGAVELELWREQHEAGTLRRREVLGGLRARMNSMCWRSGLRVGAVACLLVPMGGTSAPLLALAGVVVLGVLLAAVEDLIEAEIEGVTCAGAEDARRAPDLLPHLGMGLGLAALLAGLAWPFLSLGLLSSGERAGALVLVLAAWTRFAGELLWVRAVYAARGPRALRLAAHHCAPTGAYGRLGEALAWELGASNRLLGGLVAAGVGAGIGLALLAVTGWPGWMQAGLFAGLLGYGVTHSLLEYMVAVTARRLVVGPLSGHLQMLLEGPRKRSGLPPGGGHGGSAFDQAQSGAN